MDLLILLLIYAVPIASVVTVVRYGPLRSRWWRHENPIGFGLFVGAISFLAGFVGPMILAPDANQGPLLGILYTGPIGTLVGFAWGVIRARQRRSAEQRVASSSQ
jgi:hypothetical protein